jgi:Rha family phage regulatory protein
MDLVTTKKQTVLTDSLTVADKFGKQHKNVIQKIENLIKDDEKDRLNFRPIFYQDSYGRDQKKYDMDR